MPKSHRLRERDLGAIVRLTHECRDQGDDPVVWRRHLLAQAAGLVGADVAMAVEVAGCSAGISRDLGSADWGWEAGFDRAGWVRALAQFGADPSYDPVFVAYLRRLREQDGAAVTRPELLPDREWYRSPGYLLIHSVTGTDATLYCFRRLAGVEDVYSGLILTRGAGSPEFGEGECRLVHTLHTLAAPLIGGPLARFGEPSPSALPRRVREVLRCLLEGEGDKQVAARLRLSVYTVNQYTKVVYRHFGVSSRAELLARWLRRGWAAQCQWDS